MASIWKETRATCDLLPLEVVMVRVASFTFRFESATQLQECLRYFEAKTHPTSRVPAKELEAQLGSDWREQRGWEVERWFERLPMYLLEEPKRLKVVKALREAIELIERGDLGTPFAGQEALKRRDSAASRH